ncbi:hypoxanthine phosphoribosyltransferase [Reichenbachiella agariperforans]|uniref:Hypoxanthine phosphoribosyltransferase n=1 Tax=Reichenbachiella agariperforans TaxID=156994 RepID=A0A1M6NQX9_REIAG|nr:hypoxanthine phosphoribosyltransferase [Reichenbachiella agariperforans]SHJ98026.1 hypoxanthine phosphoribosyltransferase [Reichenbachiella agariperforans]
MIQIEDKKFVPYLTSDEVQGIVSQMADQISADYEDKPLVLLGILNGSFMFLSDLVKKMTIDPEISFLKLASYEGSKSTGKVKDLIGLDEDLDQKHVLIIEDIVDTGNTLAHIISALENEGAESVKIATLFFKSKVYSKDIPVDYVGKAIPNDFVVGYGMDYNGHGRTLPDVYQQEG